MKKIICLVASVILLLAFAACGPASGAKDTLSGTPEEILAQLKEAAEDALPMGLVDEITRDRAQFVLGLTEEQFDMYVDSAAESPGINAQSTALVKCGDSAAAKVKDLIAEGYDPGKWICAFPQKCVVVESGSYVLLTANFAETADRLVEAFRTISDGNIGTPRVFYESDHEGGGLILP